MTNLMDKEKTFLSLAHSLYAFMSNWNKKAKWAKKAWNHYWGLLKLWIDYFISKVEVLTFNRKQAAVLT